MATGSERDRVETRGIGRIERGLKPVPHEGAGEFVQALREKLDLNLIARAARDGGDLTAKNLAADKFQAHGSEATNANERTRMKQAPAAGSRSGTLISPLGRDWCLFVSIRGFKLLFQPTDKIRRGATAAAEETRTGFEQ